jgi:hypothetical protein
MGLVCFFSLLFGVKAGLHVVVSGGRELPDAVGADMMIGECQAVGRDERAGAAIIETNRR